MDFLLEIVFQFFGELLLQFSVQFMVEIGLRSLSETYKKDRHPLFASIGYAIWGGIAGALSLRILPQSMVAGHIHRLIGLLVIPIMSGIAMMLVGRLRESKGQNLVKLDRFGYAFTFAFMMTLVRFKFLGDGQNF